MKYTITLIVFLVMLTALPSTLYAQQQPQEATPSRCDSMVCFSIEDAIEMARIIDQFPLIVEELKKTEEIANEHEIALLALRPEVNKLREDNEKLNKMLNQESESADKARKSRIYWGISGAVIGSLIYSILTN